MAGSASAASTETGVNPIRRVVTLMQDMQKEVEAEGEKEAELMQKFECYCKGNTASLKQQQSDAAAKNEEMTAKFTAEQSEKKQVDEDLSEAKKDRTQCKADEDKKVQMRAKEAAEYAATKADMDANLEATSGAITSLEKGMGASFMQTSAGASLRKIIEAQADRESMDVDSKEAISAFLQGDYVPASGQIVGILKDMKDNMEKDIKEAVAAEEAAITAHDELCAAKKKQFYALTDAVESLTKRSGELAVSIVQCKNAAEDAAEESSDAAEFLTNLSKNCASKASEWEERQATRAQEVEAISAAIAILNEDDALDLFKKTLKTPETPKPTEVAFMQVKSGKGSKLAKVRAMLSAEKKPTNAAVALLQNSLMQTIKGQQQSGKVDFSKVLKMIDDMVSLLTKEQKDDEASKKYCEKELDVSDDKQKQLKTENKSLLSAIAQMKDEIAATVADITALTEKIADMDKTVADATEQRKKENAEFTSTLSANQLAIQLIGKAKNKLLKFYNPDLAVTEEEPTKTLGDELAESFIQLQSKVSTEQPEVSFSGNKTQKSGGVMALMDKLIKELETDNQEAEHEEKEAQKDYEELLAEAQKTKADDTKTMADKEATKADIEDAKCEAERSQSLKAEALKDTLTYIADLHKQCDFILASFEERREARGNEVEGLKKAKAVLSGADYSFF